MSNTLEANSVFLNPTHTECPTKINYMIMSCYKNLNILETLKGQIGVDHFNYIQEYFNRIIMILQQSENNSINKKPQFNIFTKSYIRNNINNIPDMSSSVNYNPANAEYNNQTLSVPKEYKVLTSLDKQLAFNKFGEKIITNYNNNDINNPIEAAINASQYIAGNGLDIDRHMKPMSLNKYK